MIYPSCISSSEASEIAEQEGLEKEWMGAKAWFEGVVESREEFELQEMPKYKDFVCHMDYIESDLYYDFGADYYFAVHNKLKTENMKKNKIRLTESKLKQIVAESVKNVLKEIAGKSLQENNFKSPIHRKRAAIVAGGKRRKKTPEEIQQNIDDFNAKLNAIRDINKDRNIRQMSKHEQIFNSPVSDETFDIDFDELGYYDPHYDDFSKNNKSVKDIEGSAVSSYRFPSYDEYLD